MALIGCRSSQREEGFYLFLIQPNETDNYADTAVKSPSDVEM